MTVNPNDYGDPKPSDLDDVAPVNRGDLLEEHAYRITRPIGKRIVKPRDDVKVDPETEVQLQKLPARTSFMALILERLGVGEYRVLRQDGKRGIAYTHGDDTRYDALSIGEYVSLENGTIPNTYYITGDARHNELPTLTLYNSQDIGPTDTNKKINLDSIELQTGESLLAIDGGFLVFQDTYALYEINYSFTLEQQDIQGSVDGTSLSIGTVCPMPFLPEAKNTRDYNQIKLDRDSGFYVKESKDAVCTAFVSLAIPRNNYIPQSNFVLGVQSVSWSDGPTIGNKLTIGADVPKGWLKIQNSGESYVQLSHGKQKLKFSFPNNVPVAGSHLFASGVSGECVQSRWTRAGGTGMIQAYNCYNECSTWIVADGLIISGPGISAATGTELPNCQETPTSYYECDDDT